MVTKTQEQNFTANELPADDIHLLKTDLNLRVCFQVSRSPARISDEPRRLMCPRVMSLESAPVEGYKFENENNVLVWS